jgi:hypothetical protein
MLWKVMKVSTGVRRIPQELWKLELSERSEKSERVPEKVSESSSDGVGVGFQLGGNPEE